MDLRKAIHPGRVFSVLEAAFLKIMSIKRSPGDLLTRCRDKVGLTLSVSHQHLTDVWVLQGLRKKGGLTAPSFLCATFLTLPAKGNQTRTPHPQAPSRSCSLSPVSPGASLYDQTDPESWFFNLKTQVWKPPIVHAWPNFFLVQICRI